MANRSLVSKELVVEGIDDRELGLLVDWIHRPGSGARWMIAPVEGRELAVWPPDGTVLAVEEGPAAFCAAQDAPGVEWPAAALAGFAGRFPAAADPVALLRLAGFVAPVLPDLHPEVAGIGYDLAPSAKTRQKLNLAGRFLPKGKAVALRVPLVEGEPFGLYVGFNRKREIARVVGYRGWPEAVRAGGSLKGLSTLGAPVEVGAELTHRGGQALLHDRLNRAGFAAHFKAGEIALDPCPMALKLALKAARIL